VKEEMFILEAMKTIENQTKHGSRYCIHFEKRTDKEKNYIEIQDHSGCNSLIGKLKKE
jgi:hypothetical protein